MGNYRSALTVRAHTSPELPGTEFCLTGFEDPGVQLPEAIITWVCYFDLEHCHALYHVLSLTLIFHPRSQSEECLSSCCPSEQHAWNCARKEKTVRGNPITPSFSRHKGWISIFSQFPSSWGRQEDNFGQIHQIRQQQQQYAWPCPQLSFSLGWMDPFAPFTGGGEGGESWLIRVKIMRGSSLMTYPCLLVMGLS